MNNPKPSTITHRQISDKRQDLNFVFFFFFFFTGNKGSVIDKNLKQKDERVRDDEHERSKEQQSNQTEPKPHKWLLSLMGKWCNAK